MFSRQMGLERRQEISRLRSTTCFAVGLGAGLLASLLVLLMAGISPDAMAEDLFIQVFLRAHGLSQTLTIAIPLVLVGLAAACALRLDFWNIGIEGQLWLGAIGASAISFYGIGPEGLRLPAMLLVSALMGALWITLPLLLKIRLQVNELIVTLLLSNIGYLLLQHLLFGPWRDPNNSFPVSPSFGEAMRLPLLNFGNVHGGIWLALATTLVLSVVLGHSRLGFYINVVGRNQLAARASGIPVNTTIIAMVLISGALAGLAGGVIVTGTEYRLTQNIGLNTTFSAIVVAFIARFKPIAILVTAFALAGIYNAGSTLKIIYGLSEAFVMLLQGLVLLSVLVAQFFSHYRLDIRRLH